PIEVLAPLRSQMAKLTEQERLWSGQRDWQAAFLPEASGCPPETDFVHHGVGLGCGIARASEFISRADPIEVLLSAALDDHREGVGFRRRKPAGRKPIGGRLDICEVVGVGIRGS
ncbi:MAG: hypothetical protein U1A07_06800, partial [Phenylobacterium sp.]|nr:hypothetical protein [Phenylobacterium sp.]